MQENWFFIIERLLEYGDFEAVKWSLKHFGQDKLIEVVKNQSEHFQENRFNVAKLF